MPKLHADELENSGAAELAAALGAASADHLGAISDAGIAALAASDTVATLLPPRCCSSASAATRPARRLLDAGVTMALATDFNPGSSPTPSMPLVLTLACSQMGMDPLEAIVAATLAAPARCGSTDGRGTLLPGAPADLVVWDVARHEELPYRFGSPPLYGVWKRGRGWFDACERDGQYISSEAMSRPDCSRPCRISAKGATLRSSMPSSPR
jgi:imidazolonepropionase